ncbi:hypothetical protein FPV67DRAFT_1506646 [Lyophyllum atratum]|nr:hypothetical protein FPV67DRAFT_1506646 [Lyophyllum atratum]
MKQTGSRLHVVFCVMFWHPSTVCCRAVVGERLYISVGSSLRRPSIRTEKIIVMEASIGLMILRVAFAFHVSSFHRAPLHTLDDSKVQRFRGNET